MKTVSIGAAAALRERMASPEQVSPTDPEAALPPHVESLLAQMRLLVRVPFEYLVPDSRLLPRESIRFFYLDRSFTDRLVDGAFAVGKVGSREQAHHHAHAGAIQRRLDVTERAVRSVRSGRASFGEARSAAEESPDDSDGRITGFLLRSALVANWPEMDVRAYDAALEEPVDAGVAEGHRLRTLRLERLSPSVMLALFAGVPERVVLEEPLHHVQLGVTPSRFGFSLTGKSAQGVPDPEAPPIEVPTRQAHPRVLGIAALRAALHRRADLPEQRGSADLAVQLLSSPWRQRFEARGRAAGGFVPTVAVAARITEADTREALRGVLP